MELNILKNEEKRMNTVFFVFLAVIPCVAVGYVLLFNNGAARDCIALLMVLASILVRLLKRYWESMQSIYTFLFFRCLEL